uniref:Uncharacterized protein n=1 Tax=Zea mays TaxID=4577 RepID=C0HGW2_MAIZE|nr:unknown [Zea mays]
MTTSNTTPSSSLMPATACVGMALPWVTNPRSRHATVAPSSWATQ